MSRIIKAGHLVVISENAPPKAGKEDAFSDRTVELLYQEARNIVEELINDAQDKGVKIISNAQSEGQNIIASAYKEAEKIKEQAYKEGYDSGQQQGASDFANKLAEADNIIRKAYQEREKILAGLENEILNFSVGLAEKVVRRQLEERQEIIADISKDLLLMVQDAQLVTVKICNEDLEYLNGFLPELQTILSQGTLKLEQDSTLKKGDCIVVSECGLIMAKIDGQLEKLKETLFEVMNYD